MPETRFDEQILATLAYAEVKGDTIPIYLANRGFTTTINRLGAGHYRHTLVEGRATGIFISGVFASSKGSIPQAIAAFPTSDTDIDVYLEDVNTGQLNDGAYYLHILRITNAQ